MSSKALEEAFGDVKEQTDDLIRDVGCLYQQESNIGCVMLLKREGNLNAQL